jgi:hypothetical protein
VDNLFPAPFAKEAVFSPVYVIFGSIVKNHMAVGVRLYSGVFYSFPLVLTSVFMPNTMLFLLLWLCSILGEL